MSAPKAADVKRGIAVIWENLQCPICLDLLSEPVTTKCDHQFCKFCMTKLLERSKRNDTSCPVCKMKVTKRSLQESPGFQKLVEGLQNLVQSYEFDTCTNYFTGMPQTRLGASVETESRDQMCSGENPFSEGAVLEKQASLSSSAAAKDAFTKLMGLEDSCAGPSEQDLQEKSSQKAEEPEAVPLTAEGSKTQTSPDGGSDDGTSKSRKRSSRKSKRTCFAPERIRNKRQKKSVEIVSEWLLKNSPDSATQAEGIREDDFSSSADGDTEKENTGSSETEELIVNNGEKPEASFAREAQARGLEAQVFGAVYKRERKGGKAKVSRVFSAVKSKAPDAQPVDLLEKEEKMEGRPARRTSGRKRTPVGFIKKPASTDKEERDGREREDAGCSAEEGSKPKTASGSDEHHDNEVESQAFEVPLKRPGRRSKLKMQDAWQEVDRDLSEQESNKKDHKRRVTRNSSRDSEPSKNAKQVKSLSLVSAGNETLDLKPSLTNLKLGETEVTIESYPSSSEPKSPDVRKTRRSLRLQEFTAEIQGPPKRRRSKLAFPKPADGSGVLHQSNADEPNAEVDLEDPSRGDAKEKTEAVLRKNGCVYNDDSEKIETLLSSEEALAGLRPAEGNLEHHSVSVVPDTVEQDACSATVVNTPTPLAVAAIPDSSLPEKRESPPTAAVAPFMETSVSEQKDAVEEEGDTNDSELDTEQLMKTFKTSRRKSFFLGSPRSPQSKIHEKFLEEVEQEDKDQAEVAGVCPHSQDNTGKLLPSSPSSTCVGNDVPGAKQTDFLKDSGTSLRSALSPNKVVVSQDSRPPANSEPASSCLLFSTVTQEEEQMPGSSDTAKSSESSKCPRTPVIAKEERGFALQAESDLVSNKISNIPSGTATSAGGLCNLESSVTPDGLVPHDAGSQTGELAPDQSSADGAEVLSQPCLQRKRRARRLDSSASESSVEDDLPSVAQIFGYQRAPSQSGQDHLQKVDVTSQEEQRATAGLDLLNRDPQPEAPSAHVSQSVDPLQKQERPPLVENGTAAQEDSDRPYRGEWISSSQGSVDLFGTPEECEGEVEDEVDEVCFNPGLSIDSTQYSSEILNTQQKAEMQQELRRLEKMMALVSEALQKKECDSTTGDNDKSSGPRRSVTEEETLNKRGSESSSRMELVASGLSGSQLSAVKKFAKKVQGCVSTRVTSTTTHVIIKTDEDLVCERTLKYFQGIAGRKWVVSFLWIAESFKQGKVLDEAPFEVCGDVVNGHEHNGPRRARTAAANNLLMKGYEICFQGSFTGMTTGQMESMVELCGATVMKDPLLFSKQGNCYQLVVVQPGPDDSQLYYTALQRKATVVTRSWLLDSVATYTLQNPRDYTP